MRHNLILTCILACSPTPMLPEDLDLETHEPWEAKVMIPDRYVPNLPVFEAPPFQPRACIHTLGDPRPRLSRRDQDQTKHVLNHVAKRMDIHADFRKLMMIVANRESSFQAGVIHRLPPDLSASYKSWRRMADHYEGNPFVTNASLWQTYGIFGMNSNYYLRLWDKTSDPRVLCDPIVDIVLYRRAAERALKKLQSGRVPCKQEDGSVVMTPTSPTWLNLHRAISGGKICPSDGTDLLTKRFVERAVRAGLDPYGIVTPKMLGKEPKVGLDGTAWKDQEEMLGGLWSEMDGDS